MDLKVGNYFRPYSSQGYAKFASRTELQKYSSLYPLNSAELQGGFHKYQGGYVAAFIERSLLEFLVQILCLPSAMFEGDLLVPEDL
jgi:hypothetical protein